MPPQIAVVGASGFIGSRLVEGFHLNDIYKVVAVVRKVGGLQCLSRFDLDWRMADACDASALANAFAGCRAVVHSVVGDPRVIEAAAKALLPAAAIAGVQRVVYLSTASVHGQNPAIGTSEESPLSDRQEIEYNNAKVRAERTLFRDSGRYPVELIILRPSIVFGPRDRWISTLASELKEGIAWLIQQGEGICNVISVDNLVHAVRLALEAPKMALGQAYFVSDAETVTWRQLYEQTADRLGFRREVIQYIPVPTFPGRTALDRLDGLRASPAAQRVIAKVPHRLKSMAKGALKGLGSSTPSDPWHFPASAEPTPTMEMTLLQQCRFKLPIDKARQFLRYQPLITFDEGLERAVAWLKWRES